MAGADSIADCTECREKFSEDGRLALPNPHLESMGADTLYHLSLGTHTHDLKEMFGDVKFVCMGGTPQRMESFARFVKKEIGIKLPTGSDLYDISHHSYRYCMYKIGPVLSVSHGMGAPSLSILMHEILKLIQYAECQDPILIRIGTSGGIGIPAGSVVVSNSVVNGLLKEELEMHILGQVVHRRARLDQKLAEAIVNIGKNHLHQLNIVTGKTMSTNDFYEGQARLDGAFCSYTEVMKMDYMQRLKSQGVVNIEMEAAQFASMCHVAGVRGAVVCVTLLDRLQGDQVSAPKALLLEWQERPQQLVAAYIKSVLGLLEAA
ncbi:uridine phosphorylase 2-like isoform X2 [Ornithodoros turicata]|uniref:uridine phosphorylase 2-like isoform X2 n=1 Tax=Ornithodoros turicata TaxID=34597 RepID=UPI00313932FF